MITKEMHRCPICNGELKYYDCVKRIVRTKYGKENYIYVKRFHCTKCNKFHREIPEIIFPYKHYEKEIIIGVVEGLISFTTLGFEDYPSESTIIRWIKTIDISLVLNT